MKKAKNLFEEIIAGNFLTLEKELHLGRGSRENT